MINQLSDIQQQAVLRTEGPLVIFAGAGSGKTRVITHRIAHIILSGQASPEEICAVTFTNKAAGEMLERTSRLVPEHSRRLIIRTFHSLCNYILRRDAARLGYTSAFTIYDMQMQESLVREIIKKRSYDLKLFRPLNLVSSFSFVKDALSDIGSFNPEPFDDEYGEIKNIIFADYERIKKERNAMDYGDLILNAVKLFTNHPDILQKYTSRWKYIMVDEYQDTNRIQNELVRLLGSVSGNICVVGDDDQMIYSWRGADAGNILQFETRLKDVRVVKLEENYRSSANIIKAASTLIKNNYVRKDKTIFTNNPEGEPVKHTVYENEYDEAFQVIQKIFSLIRSGIDPREIAVFYRTNFQSRTFEESLSRLNIPYKIFGGFRFFDRAEIKDIIAYLSVLINPDDTTSLLRIINVPARGIGDVTVRKLLDYAETTSQPFLKILADDSIKISQKAKANLKNLGDILLELSELKDAVSLPDLVGTLLEQTGLPEHYSTEEDYENRMENIHEFIASLREYEESADKPSLAEYLGNLALLTGGSETDNGPSSYVSLMTVHNAKGLEFDHVFITGLDEGVFPHSMSLDTKEEIEEERRLCYVAITRGRKNVHLSSRSYLKRTNVFLSSSRFIREIDDSLEAGYERVYQTEAKPAASRIMDSKPDIQGKKSDGKGFKTGDMVNHRQYGNGKIVEISGSGQNMKARIRFGMIEKNFFLAYTPLELLN